MSADHELIREDLAAYVLGGLDPATTTRVEQHLQSCRECRDTVREYRAVFELLPLALPPAPASPAGRLALQQRLRTEGRRHRTARKRVPWLRLPRRPRLASWTVAIGLLLILSGLGLWWRSSLHDTSTPLAQLRGRDDVQVVRLNGSPSAPSASGQLIFTNDLSRAGLVLSGLPPLPPDRSYQVWFGQSDQSWTSAGTFQANREGQAEVMLRLPGSLSSYGGCWITEEPLGGSPEPSGQLILATTQP